MLSFVIEKIKFVINKIKILYLSSVEFYREAYGDEFVNIIVPKPKKKRKLNGVLLDGAEKCLIDLSEYKKTKEGLIIEPDKDDKTRFNVSMREIDKSKPLDKSQLKNAKAIKLPKKGKNIDAPKKS